MQRLEISVRLDARSRKIRSGNLCRRFRSSRCPGGSSCVVRKRHRKPMNTTKCRNRNENSRRLTGKSSLSRNGGSGQSLFTASGCGRRILRQSRAWPSMSSLPAAPTPTGCSRASSGRCCQMLIERFQESRWLPCSMGDDLRRPVCQTRPAKGARCEGLIHRRVAVGSD